MNHRQVTAKCALLLWILLALAASLTSGQYPMNQPQPRQSGSWSWWPFSSSNCAPRGRSSPNAIGAGGYGSVLPGQCYDGLPKEMVPGSPCYSQADCSSRYSYSECEWNPLQNMPTTQKMCFCRCGYRYDYTSMSCINRDSCWYCSSGVILAITITILVIVIAVLFFTIPTCALLSCMGGSKQ